MTCLDTALTMGAIDMSDLDDLNHTREVAGLEAAH